MILDNGQVIATRLSVKEITQELQRLNHDRKMHVHTGTTVPQLMTGEEPVFSVAPISRNEATQ